MEYEYVIIQFILCLHCSQLAFLEPQIWFKRYKIPLRATEDIILAEGPSFNPKSRFIFIIYQIQ